MVDGSTVLPTTRPARVMTCPASRADLSVASTDRCPYRRTPSRSRASVASSSRAVPKPAWYGWRWSGSSGSLRSIRTFDVTLGSAIVPVRMTTAAQPDLIVNPSEALPGPSRMSSLAPPGRRCRRACRLLREPLRRSLARLLRLDVTVARRRAGLERFDQPCGRSRDLVNGVLEDRFVLARGPRRAAQLAHELQCGRADLLFCRGRLKVGERLDVPAHTSIL